MKRYYFLVLLLTLTFFSVFAQTGGRTQVAVMNWDAGGLEQSVVVALSDRLRMELLNTGRFDVMERNRMDLILQEQGFQQTGCTSTECVVQVGQLLGVDRMITGSIGKVGRIYTLSLQMIDIEKGRIIMSKVEDCDCPIETVLTQAIRNIALKLAGQTTTEEPSPAVVTRKDDFNSGPQHGTVTDIDGNVYQTVKIGDQWWMAENLKVTHYRNGDQIPNVTGNTEWVNLTTGAYCYYDNNSSNAAVYGALYNWYAVKDSRNIAPEGWHVPTDEEWKQLEMYLGISQSEADEGGGRGTEEGGKLRETGFDHWNDPNTGATNESGFYARPGGYRFGDIGSFKGIGYVANFWSSTEYDNYYVWNRELVYGNASVGRYTFSRQEGFSIRLVRD